MIKALIFRLATLLFGLLFVNMFVAENYMIKTAQGSNRNNTQIQPRIKVATPPLHPGLLGSGADVARTWVTPPLVNDPGNINGKRVLVDGISQKEHFVLHFLNLDAYLNAQVNVYCYAKDGRSRSGYHRSYNVAPKRFVEWDSDIVIPPPSGKATVMDKETIWCAAKSSIPIFAYGLVHRRSYQGTYAVPIWLMRAAK